MSATGGNRCQALADEIISVLDKLTGYRRFIQIARKTARGIDPFVNITAVINYGLWYHFGHTGEEEEPTSCSTDLRQRYLDVFEEMIALNDDFLEILNELQQRPDKYFVEFMKNLQFARHYGKARSEDTSSVQSKITTYVQMAGYGQLSTTDRKQLGWNDEVSARMLCPCARLDEFDQNPQAFMNRIKNSVDILDTFDWATFLYNEKLPYEPDAQDKGLFQGTFLVKVYLHLFCGPGVATNGLTAPITKSSKGDRIGLSSATPMTIAYAISQSYYVLTSSGYWNHTCLHVDLSKLFSGVLELFREDEDWSNETISWWNKQLRFKAKTGSLDDLIASNSSNMDNIRAQRARRRSATVSNTQPLANRSVSPTEERPPSPGPLANNGPSAQTEERPPCPPADHSVSPTEERPRSPLANNGPSAQTGQRPPSTPDISRALSPLSDLEPELEPDNSLSTSNTNAATAQLASMVGSLGSQTGSSAMMKKKSGGGRKRKVTNPEGQNMPPPASGSDSRRSKRQRKTF
ncbi:hypothetical protein JOM56_015727 [Amanita muscaria]